MPWLKLTNLLIIINLIILGFWLFDKNGNPVEEKKPDSAKVENEENAENLDFLTEKYLISDLFSGNSWKVTPKYLWSCDKNNF